MHEENSPARWSAHWSGAAACVLLAGMTLASGMASAAVPTTQQAIVQTGHGGPEVLQLRSVPVLAPGNGHVLLQVLAAAINPVDWHSRETGKGDASLIPGYDVAGRVAALGAGVSSLQVGEAVFGVTGRDEVGGLNGAYAQYVVVPADFLVAKPANISFEEAAGLGTATLAGIRVVDQLHVQPGERVLITGVAGGVGSAAAQAALARGALVIGTASPRHADYLHQLGVQFIDYTQHDWAARARAAMPQVVIDTVGADTAASAFGVLASGGRFASVGAHDYTPEKCRASGVICPPGGSVVGGPVPTALLLHEAAQLAASGRLRVHVDRAYPLAQAGAAQEFNREGHTEGKVVLAIGSAAAGR